MMQNKSFYARYGFGFVCLAVFLLPIILFGARSAMRSNTNDVREWLPKEYGETAVYAWFQSHFGNEEFVVATWEGCTVGDDRLSLFEAKLSAATAARREGEPEIFKRVITGESIIEELSKPPLNLTAEQVKQRFEGVLFGPELEQTCAVIILTDEAKKHLKPTLALVRSIAAESGVPPGELRLGGPPVANAAIDVASARSLLQLAALSGVVGLIIAWWCFRTVRLTLMVFFAGLYSAAASLAVVSISGSSMNAILMTMAPLVYVAATSGAIHLSNYYRDAVQEKGPAGAASRAIKHAWLPLGLATSTTAIGLLSLLYSELHPIETFGLFSAIGVVISLFVLFLVLPSALELWPPKEKRRVNAAGEHHETGELPLSPGWRKFAETVIAHHGWVSLAAFAVLAFCAAGLWRVETSIKIMRFFRADTPIIEDYQWLETHLGGMVPMEVVVRIDENSSLNMLQRLELIEEVQQKIEVLPEVGSSLSAADFTKDLPSRRNWPNVRYSPARSTTAKRLDANIDRLEETNYLAEAEGEQLWRVSVRVTALGELDYGEFIHTLEKQVDPILEIQQAAILEKNQSEIQETESRLKELRVRARELAAAAPGKQGAGEPAAGQVQLAAAEGDQAAREELLEVRTEQTELQARLAKLKDPGISATYTGMVPIVYKAQRSLLDGMLFGFSTDLALVVVAIMVLMRHWSSGALLCLTSIFPTTVVFGIMGWSDIIVDVGTVMTPSVALGVTIDDVVHFILWFRRGIEKGLGRKQAVMLAYEGCARAMYQSWGVIGLGLSMFALSSFMPTMRFGALMVALLTAGLMGNLFFLPALLSGPLGGIVERSVLARAERKKRASQGEGAQGHMSELSPAADVLVRPDRRSVKT